jgi:hypothetical protein
MCGCQYVLKPQVVQALSGRGLRHIGVSPMSNHSWVCKFPLGRNLPLMESHVVGLLIYRNRFLPQTLAFAQFWVPIPNYKTSYPTFLQSHQPFSSFFSFLTMFRCPTCRIHQLSSADQPITSFPLFCTLNSKTAYHIPPIIFPLFLQSSKSIHVPMSQSAVPTNIKSIFHPIIFLVLGVNQQLICSVVITVS